MHRRARRDDQLVDAGDTLVGIDEQPLPVERDDLDLQRLGFATAAGRPGSRSWEPIQATPPRNMMVSSRDRPDDQLDAARIDQSGSSARPRVGGAEPPGDADVATIVGMTIASMIAERVEQDLAVGLPDIAARIEHAGATGNETECHGEGRMPACAADRCPSGPHPGRRCLHRASPFCAERSSRAESRNRCGHHSRLRCHFIAISERLSPPFEATGTRP